MDALALLARRKDLQLIEDAAQAHGASWRGNPAGSLGDVAAFSFYPSKPLGALGDGGAICTGDAEIAACCRRLRNLGQRSKGEHIDAGFNERLDGVQAAMLRVKLERLEQSNQARRTRASLYREVLPDDCRLLGEDPRGECVYHLFPIRTGRRDQVREHLRRRGVGTGVHYWPALHRQPLFSDVGLAPGELPNATRWSEEEISLPMFAELTDDEVVRVGEAVDLALAEEAR
jgi:dTDP-4-amino-4,6-dideoxygalactose transaminase